MSRRGPGARARACPGGCVHCWNLELPNGNPQWKVLFPLGKNTGPKGVAVNLKVPPLEPGPGLRIQLSRTRQYGLHLPTYVHGAFLFRTLFSDVTIICIYSVVSRCDIKTRISPAAGIVSSAVGIDGTNQWGSESPVREK